jgi:hypothetical protein
MKTFVPALVAALFFSAAAHAAEKNPLSFKKIQLSDQFWAEGANFGDFNRDGHNDVVAGSHWWAGPDFKAKHEYAPATQKHKAKKEDGAEIEKHGFDPLGYSKNFIAHTYDLNADGWTDILILGFPGEESFWYENPKGKTEGHWTRHVAIPVTDNESPTFTDLTGDNKPEIVCNSGGHFVYAEPNWKEPTKPWTIHKISPKGNWQRFTHGLGIGDVNSDGRLDILEKDGWWEQPSSLKDDPEWKQHKYAFAPGTGSSQMYAYDVDGDGDNDVISALNAHGYGLAWFEHKKEGSDITFTKHVIMGDKESDNKYGIKFSQLHAVDLVDMDGDGLRDIVSGKRWWAHGPTGDADPNADPVLFWFKLTRSSSAVDWVPYMIDNASGVGTQVVAGRVDKDTRPDVVIGNKRGAFLFLQQGTSTKR